MALVLLEAFDDPEDACEAVPEGPSEDWLDGHAAGVAEGAACAARDAARRSAELTQALSDLGFTLAEARRVVLDSLSPLFSALVDKIVPQLLEASAVTHAVDLLSAAAADQCDPPVALSVHPDLVDTLAEALAGLPSAPVDLRSDETLGRLEIVLSRRDSDRSLDLDRLTEELASLLRMLAPVSTDEKECRHG